MEESEERSITIRNRVKIFLGKKGKKIATDCFPVLEKKFKSILLDASNRAENNNRKTILVWDL